jgi:glycosyltransferase involved in cell wall biosynthesis
LKSEKPLVTIITLVYNTGHLVVEAIESVKNQDYDNIQHIIIDDFSTDDSVKIVKEWIVSNNYTCEFIVHTENKGISSSLNEGLRLSKGKYFSVVCDDLFLPNKFKRQINLFDTLDEDFAVVYTNADLIDITGKHIGDLFNKFRGITEGPSGDIFEELFFGNFIHGAGCLFKLSLIKKAGGFNEGLIVEDIDFYLKIAKQFKFKYDPIISSQYRIHANSLLQTIGIKGLEQNILSLLPYYQHSSKTKKHFLKYFDTCLNEFYSQNYINWKKWFMYRWKIKKDVKSLYLFCLAIFSINHFLFRK